jgi:ribosome biogenesis GTPase A
MPIQWFPGHMTKARRLIAESMPAQDVVVEVLDARLPLSSENPLLAELRGSKPCIKVLAKSDLADPKLTKDWVRFFEEPGVAAIAVTTKQPAELQKIPALCKHLMRKTKGTPRVMIVGVPNVGKSTLINTLLGRKAAKVGDEPAVTKSQQVVTLADGTVLSDNPGITWPKIDDEDASLRLAFAGSIPDTAIDYETVAMWGAAFLLSHYASALVTRFKLKTVPPDANGLLEEIGRRRGALRAGGVIDLHRAADALIHDFRSGAIGRITLESPPSTAKETANGR